MSPSIPESGTYLIVNAIIDASRQLTVLPSWTTESPHEVSEDEFSPVLLEAVDADGRVIGTHSLAAARVCAEGGSSESWLVAAKVPFAPATRTLRFRLDDEIVHVRDVPEQPPRVRFTWRPEGEVNGVVRLAWTAEGDGEELQFIVAYSWNEGRTWQPVSLATAERSLDVNVDSLPGGDQCRFQLVASDGVRSSAVISEPFRRPLQPCHALILSPQDAEELSSARPAVLSGQGYWAEEERPELELLRWRSSKDGELGAGPLLERSLSPGEHTITLLAGTGDREGRDEVTVDVTERSREDGELLRE
jgi:hypothetical protein